MRRALRWIFLAGVAAAAAGVITSLPPRSGRAAPPRAGPDAGAPRTVVVPGAYHVHSDRSDGSGSVDEIAAAAARAGLRFVILTDHGDATRPPDPPAYRAGVLCIDAVEISTNGGHYVALGLPASPYPLGGDARDVIEDVDRLGGFGVVAHPDSPKPSLAWRDWDEPIAALEWINADSEWRDESWTRLGRSLLAIAFRAPEGMAQLLDRPTATLARWDALSRRQPVAGFAATDAHARLGPRGWSEPFDSTGLALPVPSYRAIFETIRFYAELDVPLTGAAPSDARRLIDALMAGRSFTVIAGLAAPTVFEYWGETTGAVLRMGQRQERQDPVTLHARAGLPPGGRLVLLRDGVPVKEDDAGVFREKVSEAGVYRVEAHVPKAPGTPAMPWIVSAPIVLAGAPTPPVMPRRWVADDPLPSLEASQGHVEGDDESIAALEAREGYVAFPFTLAPPGPKAPWVAAVFPIRFRPEGTSGIVLDARADRPLRLAVQLRESATGARWRRSAYVEHEEPFSGGTGTASASRRTLPLGEFVPVEPGQGPLDQARIDTLLLVIDTVNTSPGTSGLVWLRTAGAASLRAEPSAPPQVRTVSSR